VIHNDKNAPTSPRLYPEELRTLLLRGTKGDPAVGPALKKAFDEHPELVELFGDVARHAEQTWIALAARTDLVAKEAITRHITEFRSRLAATTTTELEKVLVDRVVISTLAASWSDGNLSHELVSNPSNHVAIQAAQKRLNASHDRLLKAIKTLTVVQRLARPALSPVDIASRFNGKPATQVRRAQMVPSDCVGVVD